MRWLVLGTCDTGQRWGAGTAALAAVRMATTNNNQLKGAAKETMVAATVTGSSKDCNSGNDSSGKNGSGDDGGCSDGDGNTVGGSGGVNRDSDGGNCDSNA